MDDNYLAKGELFMEYPYVVANKSLTNLFDKIRAASKPQKFTIEFLRQIGLTSSNDRSFPPLLKKLGFLTDDGTPTIYYDQLRDVSTSKHVLADRIKSLYSELFLINTSIQSASDIEIKGAISRVTGKDETSVQRIFLTFKALCSLSDFKNSIIKDKSITQHVLEEKKEVESEKKKESQTSFHYNIQIHLPATTDISVYNAIFKSIRENFD